MPELEERHQRLLLEMARCAPDPYHPDDWAGDALELGRTFVRLEMAGLAESAVGGRRWLTQKGDLVAARLQE